MKKFAVRKAEALRTTAAFYGGICGGNGSGPIVHPGK